jgi:hypothetical protein
LGRLDWGELLQRDLDVVVVQDLLKISNFLLCDLVLGGSLKLAEHSLRGRDHRLIFGIINVDGFVRCKLWPVIPFFIVEKIINEKDMSEIHETVAFPSLLDVLLVYRNF